MRFQQATFCGPGLKPGHRTGPYAVSGTIPHPAESHWVDAMRWLCANARGHIRLMNGPRTCFWDRDVLTLKRSALRPLRLGGDFSGCRHAAPSNRGLTQASIDSKPSIGLPFTARSNQRHGTRRCGMQQRIAEAVFPAVPKWRNWQTHGTQNPAALAAMRVRPPPSAPIESIT